MMQVLTLARYYLKRIIRHRTLIGIAFGLPLVMGLLRKLLPEVGFTVTLAWVCPLICAAYVFGVIYMQKAMDKSSGLMDGFRSSPLSYARIVWAQTAAGAVIFSLQMAVFEGMVSI
ncbi:MAG: hypothetical protein NT018_02310 [Armatimonadetes bacterium]|nr:hypothetical protein [Armatimonadota bacterium]